MGRVHELAAQIKERLESAGIPYKGIKVYGRQIMVTAWSFKAACQWADLIGNFATVMKVYQAIDENEDTKNQSSGKRYRDVWRVYATI